MNCTKCGKPLPENGVCSCRQRKTGTLANAVRSLPILWRIYWRDPVALTRRLGERRDWLRGLLVLLATIPASLLSSLSFALRFASGFSHVFTPWVTAGVFAPLLTVVMSFGLLYLLTSIAKMRVDLREATAMLGVNALFPLTLLLLSIVLSLIHPFAFHALSVLALAAWGVSFFAVLYEGFGLRMNALSLLVLVGGLAAACGGVWLLRGWLVTAVL